MDATQHVVERTETTPDRLVARCSCGWIVHRSSRAAQTQRINAHLRNVGAMPETAAKIAARAKAKGGAS